MSEQLKEDLVDPIGSFFHRNPFEVSDDDMLKFAQAQRLDLLGLLTRNADGSRNTQMDVKEINAARGLLKDTDSSVYTKRRLNIDEVQAEQGQRAAELAEMIMEGMAIPTRDKNGMQKQERGRGPEVDSSKLPEFDILDGEVTNVGDEVDLDKIMTEGKAAILKKARQDAGLPDEPLSDEL